MRIQPDIYLSCLILVNMVRIGFLDRHIVLYNRMRGMLGLDAIALSNEEYAIHIKDRVFRESSSTYALWIWISNGILSGSIRFS